MIKGVNKKVIEINHPDSVYFERAVLYLRPEVAEVPMQQAEEETAYYFRQSAAGQNCSRLPGWLTVLLVALPSAGLGMLAGWLIL